MPRPRFTSNAAAEVLLLELIKGQSVEAGATMRGREPGCQRSRDLPHPPQAFVCFVAPSFPTPLSCGVSPALSVLKPTQPAAGHSLPCTEITDPRGFIKSTGYPTRATLQKGAESEALHNYSGYSSRRAAEGLCGHRTAPRAKGLFSAHSLSPSDDTQVVYT